MNSSSTASWEMGTATQALLEHDLSSVSVFAKSPAFAPSSSLTSSSIDSVLYFAQKALKQRNGTTTIIKDGAAGDPASLGVAVILGNLTNADTGITNLTYAQAAEQELEFLLTKVPRASNGAISHRNNEVSLWSDFIYMVPPFLAYYGVVTENTTLIQLAVDQISAYRDELRDTKTSLWKHVVISTDFNDLGLWSTGNGWAAAGITRVLATIQNSQYSGKFGSQRKSLTTWANEIHQGYYALVDGTSHLGHNYINDTSTFLDASGATLIASSVFRLSTLSGKHQYVPNALTYLSSLTAGNISTGPSIDSNGWLTPVVDPLTFDKQGKQSPESQSFVLLLDAAHKDWVSAGSKGANAAVRPSSSALVAMGAALGAVAMVAVAL